MADELELLKGLGRTVTAPDEASVRRARSLLQGRIEVAGGLRRPWRPFHVRSGVAVAVALLAGSGFGFGLGSQHTADGSAARSVVGFGFMPARGWTVLQSGTADRTGAFRAIAANATLHPDDELGGSPHATLASLSARGVVIAATLTPRGDPGHDMSYADRGLPLQISSAKPTPSSRGLHFARRLAQYRLRAAIGGYNVDARIYFGTAPPSPSMVGAAQRQLSRLVVASERVTMVARPTVVGGEQKVTLFGSVDSRSANEIVTIQAKDCGSDAPSFRDVAEARTREGGGWSTEFSPRINTTLRAVWSGEASAQVAVRRRAYVLFRPAPWGRLWVSVGGKASFRGKRVLIQRFGRRLGTWSTVKSVVLTETGAYEPATGMLWSSAKFPRASLPKRALHRAVLPRSQARPCFLAGYSNTLRTSA